MKQIRTFEGNIEFIDETVNKFLSTLSHGANPQIIQNMCKYKDALIIIVTVVYEAFN
jgi:hypothetical protein